MTSLICILISRIVSLRMNEDDLESGDDAAHGEEAYALWVWGDGGQHANLSSLANISENTFHLWSKRLALHENFNKECGNSRYCNLYL